MKVCSVCKRPGHTKEECPLLAKFYAQLSHKKSPSLDLATEATSVFVGAAQKGKVRVGVLNPEIEKKDSWFLDAPKAWAARGATIPQIVSYRMSLLNSSFFSSQSINQSQDPKLLDQSQEISLSIKPVHTDFSYHDTKLSSSKLDSYSPPYGPNRKVKKVTPQDTIKIPRSLQYCVDDTDLKAAEALNYLQKKGFDENQLTKVFSLGNLGEGKNRSLVPTRNSITAVDDTMSKPHLQAIRYFDHAQPQLFSASYLGNFFLVLVFEHSWSFELHEAYYDTSNLKHIHTTSDYEGFKGRTTYAENCAGGYYATRLAVTERLLREKQQGSVFVFRFITDEYSCPLGVWVVRETMRKAMRNTPIFAETNHELIQKALQLMHKEWNVDLGPILKQSKVYKNLSQRSLHEW